MPAPLLAPTELPYSAAITTLSASPVTAANVSLQERLEAHDQMLLIVSLQNDPMKIIVEYARIVRQVQRTPSHGIIYPILIRVSQYYLFRHLDVLSQVESITLKRSVLARSAAFRTASRI